MGCLARPKPDAIMEPHGAGRNWPVVPTVRLFVCVEAARRSRRLWHSLHEENQDCPDLQETGNLRAVRILLGHTKFESAVRYLGVEVDDALRIAEQFER
jgi:hypothetical protein